MSRLSKEKTGREKREVRESPETFQRGIGNDRILPYVDDTPQQENVLQGDPRNTPRRMEEPPR
jgi:hypothetical protein